MRFHICLRRNIEDREVGIEFARSHSPHSGVRTLNVLSLHFKSICLHNFAEERTGIHVRLYVWARGMEQRGV